MRHSKSWLYVGAALAVLLMVIISSERGFSDISVDGLFIYILTVFLLKPIFLGESMSVPYSGDKLEPGRDVGLRFILAASYMAMYWISVLILLG